MARRKPRQLYSSTGQLSPRRLLVFGLPTLAAGALLGLHHLSGHWLDDYIWYIAPVTMVAMTVFAYGLFKVSLELREQARINHRLNELQNQHGKAEELGSIGSWILDLKEDQFYWTNGSFRLFGVEPIEGTANRGAPSRQGFFINIHPEDQPKWKEAHRQSLRQGETIQVEYRYQKRNPEGGSATIWVRSEAQPEYDAEGGHLLRLVGFAQDITLIQNMKDDLKASAQKFENLSQLGSDWNWEMNAQFQFTSISGTIGASLESWAKRMKGHGLRDAAIPEMAINRFALPQDKSKVPDARAGSRDKPVFIPKLEKLEEHLNARTEFKDLQFALLTPESELLMIQLSGRPLSSHGTPAGFQGIGRTVTEEAQREILLSLESKLTDVIRTHDDESEALTEVICTVCEEMGWLGGAMLKLIPGTQSLAVHERWGNESVLKMLGELPQPIPISANSVEKMAWDGGRKKRSMWLNNMAQAPAFAQRYQTARIQAPAVLMAPILNEKEEVLATLMFFSPINFKSNLLISGIADMLSNTMSMYLQRKSAEQRLRRASQHDALTGLPNRAYLTEHLEKRLSRREPLALLYIDLDRYKAINDTLGHQAGDQVLVEIAQRFKATIGPGNIAARMGGDEFVLLLDKQNNAAQAEAVARQVLTAAERPFILKGRAHFLSASIGIALSPLHGSDASTLIRCADNAMYTVKSEGRNDVRIYNKQVASYRDTQQLTTDLPLAMQRGEVELHYQPVISAHDRSVVGLEALIRWRHPSLGLLLPDTFLPLAEQSNLMREVGIWTIRRALDDRLSLGLGPHDDLVVSVNVSPNQLNEEDFLTQISTLLRERNFPPHLLRLELTESTLIEGSSRTHNRLQALRRLGVEVVIDNFGTGYASLSYLRNLPISGLKIDHTFIKGLPEDKGNAAIVQAIMTLAEKLHFKVIAEGISSHAEMIALRDFGCSRMQGNFLSRPLTMQELVAYLKQANAQPRQLPKAISDAARAATARPARPQPLF
ncbi:MAG: EAL domain-containing protein [Lautropia sp.]|nr:EAL domain-containing protein [Lautropia sp.]